MNVIKEIKRINERELEQGLSGKASWHHEYKDSAWIFAGGFPYDLTEGDVLCVMSQWGEIEDINLCRDKDTGKSKGFCFIKYEDQRSTILAVDNFNGIELLGRTIRVDHKHKYSLPAEVREKAEKEEEERLARGEEPSYKGPQWRPGIAYEGKQLANANNFHRGVDVFAASTQGSDSSDQSDGNGSRAGKARGGETPEAKAARRNAKKERKEARREARERKKRKHETKTRDHSASAVDGAYPRDGKKKHKKDRKGEREERPQGVRRDGRGGREDADTRNGHHGREGQDGRKRADERRGADSAGPWERGERVSGGAAYPGVSSMSSSSQTDSRPAAPAPLSTGNVMDWRGLGGTGGRGGRGRGGKGGREVGRGGVRDGHKSAGVNSMGGMDRDR